VQGDAERLPFADGTFDIVYSNGVLHHSPHTGVAIDEMFRVLKPGGRAVVMLYCKSSFHYWFTLFLCTGLLKGAIFKHRDWLGHATEWIGDAPQTATNPITRCYTGGEVRALFRRFERVSLRKSEFTLAFVPKLGRLWRRLRARQGKLHPGGALVYGAPWVIAAPFELWLGRRIGWAWNIAAVKPA
jgi:SAM-dependent methyltransferase